MTGEIRIVPAGTERDAYLPLLRLADDSESAVRGYYQTGDLYALDDEAAKPLGMVLAIPESAGTVELKSVAVAAPAHNQGVGKRMLSMVLADLRNRGVRRVIVGTGSCGIGQLAFYQKAGFRLWRVDRDFFTAARGYPDGLEENGIPLRDMVWLDQRLDEHTGDGPERPITGRTPLFCDTALAARIERLEARLIADDSAAAHRRAAASSGDSSGFLLPIAGGVASFAEPDSPFNKVAGLGFDGVPSAAALAEVEDAFAARGAPVQIELAHLGDPTLGALLTERGYRLVSFENVLGISLADRPERLTPPGIEVRLSGDEEFDAWIDVVVAGAIHPDTQGVPSHEEFPRDVLERAERDSAVGLIRYVALRDGVFAGGASFTMMDGIAALTGAATAPEHRRRGVQSALLSARLAHAAAAGCDVAVVTTQPGSKSHQNAQRRGFDLLYTRAVLVKPA